VQPARVGRLPPRLWYSAPILAILGAHEMGHYLACRYYRVDASLPYFLPAPFLLTGTLGAVHSHPAADPQQARALRHRHSPVRLPVSRGRSRCCSSASACRRVVRIPLASRVSSFGEPLLLKG
jgi:hypothetical protein